MSTDLSIKMAPKRSYIGVLGVFGLMALTLYMAVAFPYTISFLKQTETTEIKAVIVVGRGGEKTPQPESYFIGEEPPEELQVLGHEQLTNTGKERMFMLGKFLKLRYYHLLLDGDPRRIYARAADTDRSLESAQALIAGLNPPKDKWVWSTTGDLANWQPKAIHTTSAASDDLLSMEPNCARLEQDRLRWKNSSKYAHLLNEFRHDLETLRTNTGLEFEDDLEMLVNIEESLRTRLEYTGTVPAWYTPTFASRLAHIADVATENRYASAEVQRLYVGRLLHEVVENVNSKIRQNQQMLNNQQNLNSLDDKNNMIGDETIKNGDSPPPGKDRKSALSPTAATQASFGDGQPSVFIYMGGKQRLAALLNTLQIYSSLQTGSLLLIELHYDPINQLHFLRLFTVSSSSPNVFPEPLRVNPHACLDSRECSPQQFEQNIRHLMLDKSSWLETCSNTQIAPLPLSPPPPTTTQPPLSQPPTSTPHDSASTASSLDKLDASLLVGPNIETQTESGKGHSAATTTQQTNGALTTPDAPITLPATTTLAPTTTDSHQESKMENKIGDYMSNHLTRDIYYPENQPH